LKPDDDNEAAVELGAEKKTMDFKRMLVVTTAIALAVADFTLTTYAATITYAYDSQHRLVRASYSASQQEFFNHDAAGNVDQHVVITDAKYLQSWLLYFSIVDPWPTPGVNLLKQAVTECLSPAPSGNGPVLLCARAS